MTKKISLETFGLGSTAQGGNQASGEENLRLSAENQIENYLHGLEKRIEETNEEKINLLQENKDLKNKLLEISQFLTENEKSREQKDQKVRENLQLLMSNNEMLKKENIQLRTEMKNQLTDKTEMLDRMQKYDKLVDELKNYNQELLNTVKQYEEQNKLLKDAANNNIGGENITEFKKHIEEYEKKVSLQD